MTRPRYSRLLPWGVVLGLALSLLAAWAYGQTPSCASVYVPRSNCARLFRDWSHLGDIRLFPIDRTKPGLPTGERWHLHERDAATGQVVNYLVGCDAERMLQPVCVDPFYTAVGGQCRLETSADYDALVDYLATKGAPLTCAGSPPPPPPPVSTPTPPPPEPTPVPTPVCKCGMDLQGHCAPCGQPTPVPTATPAPTPDDCPTVYIGENGIIRCHENGRICGQCPQPKCTPGRRVTPSPKCEALLRKLIASPLPLMTLGAERRANLGACLAVVQQAAQAWIVADGSTGATCVEVTP